MKQVFEDWLKEQQSKDGYVINPPNGCVNCNAKQVVCGEDSKHRCKACGWLLEDFKYDYDFMEYLDESRDQVWKNS